MYSSRQSILLGIVGVLVILVLIKESQTMNIGEQKMLQQRQLEDDQEEINREKRFARILTCHTDLDCQGLDRLSCCVKSEVGYFRVCKALSSRGSQCNMHIQPHLWEGSRGGWTCPCSSGLECVQTSRSAILGRCM